MRALEVAKKIKFDFGEQVEFAIKSGKDIGIVGNIKLYPDDILYCVIWSDKSVKEHYDFELKKIE